MEASWLRVAVPLNFVDTALSCTYNGCYDKVYRAGPHSQLHTTTNQHILIATYSQLTLASFLQCNMPKHNV